METDPNVTYAHCLESATGYVLKVNAFWHRPFDERPYVRGVIHIVVSWVHRTTHRLWIH